MAFRNGAGLTHRGDDAETRKPVEAGELDSRLHKPPSKRTQRSPDRIAAASHFQQAKKPTEGLGFYKLWQSPTGPPAGNPRRAEADASGLQGLAADGVLQRARAAKSDRALGLRLAVGGGQGGHGQRPRCREEAEVAPVIDDHRRSRIDHHPGQRRRDRHRHHRVDPRLYDPGLQPRGVCLSDPRRAGQCAEDHSRHGLCARSQDRQRRRRGRSDDHRDPRHQASDRVSGRSHQQSAEAHPHHGGIPGQGRDQAHDQLAAKIESAGIRRGQIQTAH